jgi:hypothetical protein
MAQKIIDPKKRPLEAMFSASWGMKLFIAAQRAKRFKTKEA